MAETAETAARGAKLANCVPDPTKVDPNNASTWEPRVLHLVGTKPWDPELLHKYRNTYFTQLWLQWNASVPRDHGGSRTEHGGRRWGSRGSVREGSARGT